MGNTLAPMQRGLILMNTDSARDAGEMLDRLEEMAQDRSDLFYDRIGHDDLDRHLIPINTVLSKYTHIGVAAGETDLVWIQAVRGAVNEFSAGPIADGFDPSGAACLGLTSFHETSAISIDPLGGISRLDYFIFTYCFSSTELVKRKACLIACCVVESSANIDDIDSNTLRVIVSRALRGGNIPFSTLTAIYAQLATLILEPAPRLSLTEKDKECLENWYEPNNQKLLTKDASSGGDGITPERTVAILLETTPSARPVSSLPWSQLRHELNGSSQHRVNLNSVGQYIYSSISSFRILSRVF